MKLPFGLLFILLSSFSFLTAQTCCSGGVPLSSNLGLPAGTAGTLQFNISYDLNVLNTLKTGTEVLPPTNGTDRNRQTHSILLETGYSFSDRFSVDLFFSWVRQERKNFRNGNLEEFVYTNGIGDAVVLFKYQLFNFGPNKTTLSIGPGIKLPLGASNKTFKGRSLNADLQPGSGAWDQILWGQFTQAIGFRPSMTFSLTGLYRFRGVNEDYLGDPNPSQAQPYQFGRELQFILGLSDRVFIGKSIIDPSLSLLYRHAEPDQQRFPSETVFNTLPNTGGSWIFFSPSISYWFRENLSINTNVELPIFASTVGTQVSPTYRLQIGFYYQFNTKNKNPFQ